MAEFMERVSPVVDKTIAALAKTKFNSDPIGGERYSRQTSIISSSYKRHGTVLEHAIREGLRDSNRHRVWQDDVFRVSRAAENLVNSAEAEDCLQASLPYGEGYRTVQVDMIVYDDADRALRAYEIKRGNGHFDAGKKRSILRDLVCVHVLLKSYGETFKLDVNISESRIIFYYGIRSIPRPFSLVGDELDEHFSFPLQGRVEQANTYFQEQLYALLDQQ